MATEWQWDRGKTVSSDGYEISVDYDSGGIAEERQPAEFAKFEALTRDLLNVTKADLDEERSSS